MVGILHPGRRGSLVASALAAAGTELGCALDGRSAQTAARAHRLGMSDAGTGASLAARCALVIVVTPPLAAAQVIGELGPYDGVVVVACELAPAGATTLAARLAPAGGSFVDAAMIEVTEPPGITVCLSGERARPVAELFERAGVPVSVLDAGPFAASALHTLRALERYGTPALDAAVAELLRPSDAAAVNRPSSVVGDRPSPVVGARPSSAGGDRRSLLAGLLRRKPDSDSAEQVLSDWEIALGADEQVRWFGSCVTDRGRCFMIVSGRRLWCVDPADPGGRLERSLDAVISLQRGDRPTRLQIVGDGWAIDVRGVDGGRSLEELRQVLAAAPIDRTGPTPG
jgi:hypothetical protein